LVDSGYHRPVSDQSKGSLACVFSLERVVETQVRTPQMVFMQPQRLIVPLFQRPYVWNEDNQWEPLWNDVVHVARRLLDNPGAAHHPHFLGAVVFQQVQNPAGTLQERTIIDGQQRMTTLQFAVAALSVMLRALGHTEYLSAGETCLENSDERNMRDKKIEPFNCD